METTIVNYWAQCRDKWIIGSPAPIHTSLSMAQGRSWRGDIQTVREYQEAGCETLYPRNDCADK